MTSSKVTAATAGELRSFAQVNDLNRLIEALSLIHSWGLHQVDYLPVLTTLLPHKDTEVQRLTLACMLNFALYKVEQFFALKDYLPVFQGLLTTQPLALDLILALCGPSHDLVPHLKAYLARFPEEGCDLVVEFGPIAKDLVPDLMQITQNDDWDTVWAAVDALGAIGPEAAKAIPMLEQLTRHRSGVVTGSACVALERITGLPKESWPRGPRSH